MATIYTYDLKGNKLSFANWISNLTPTDTPFVSMTGKESISQTKYQWQTDYIEKAVTTNAQIEGSVAVATALTPTTVVTNNTQILRKVVAVSDTASAIASYGRGKELQYQMEKAGKEIKRDLESAFLNNGAAVAGNNSGTARTTAGFASLVSTSADPDTGVKVTIPSGTADLITEKSLFELTLNLYMAGSDANTIMFHPKHAEFFAQMMEKAAAAHSRTKMFSGSNTTFTHFVDSIVDPLGTEFKLIPNRFMPEAAVYILNPSDWTQMVFRAPERVKLAKDGSYEKWMIEMEVGLRHRNPYASGVLKLATNI